MNDEFDKGLIVGGLVTFTVWVILIAVFDKGRIPSSKVLESDIYCEDNEGLFDIGHGEFNCNNGAKFTYKETTGIKK